MDDVRIIETILSGKIDYYAELMDKYHNEIFSFVFNMLGNYQDTEDITQEIFIKTYKNLKKFNPKKASFRTWLYRIASNHTINYLNSKKFKYLSTADIEKINIESTDNIEEKLIKDEQINRIVLAMKTVLTMKHQEIVSLHYFSGLTVKEISKALDIPDKTIYKALKTSLNKLRKEVNINE